MRPLLATRSSTKVMALDANYRECQVSLVTAPFHFVRSCVITPLLTPVPDHISSVGVYYNSMAFDLFDDILNHGLLIRSCDLDDVLFVLSPLLRSATRRSRVLIGWR
jgi:hypothetical protein